MLKLNLILLALLIVINGGVNAMTKEQLKNSGKLMKKTCMPKHSVTEDQVGEIGNGKFIEERNVMCYVACVFQMSQLVKNNKINYEASIKQVDLLYPADMKEAVKAAITNCKDVAKKYKDLCESAYWTTKCVYDTDPKNFLFP